MCFLWVVALRVTWAAESRSGGVTVVVREVRGVYQVHRAFQVAVPVAVAWDVLVDHEHIGAFVHSRPDGKRVLRQRATVTRSYSAA